MRNILLLIALTIVSSVSVCAQMTLLSGTIVKVSNGSNLIVNDIKNTSGTIENAGTCTIKGDLTNNSGGLFDSGSVGTVTFNGINAQEITGAATVHYYGTLNINNSNSVSITNTVTGAAQQIHGTLSFTNGKLNLTNFDLTLAGTADPSGVGATSYIVTNGTGQLKRTVDANDILFPVGISAYNPITLNNTGTSDTYGVIVVDSKPLSFSGTEHIVNRSWDVTELVSGNSNLTVSTQWNSTEEATGFDRTASCVGITNDAGANVEWGSTGIATGSNPYTRSSTNISTVGTLMVGDYYYGGYAIDLKIILAASWNTTNDNMDKTLNTSGLIPLSDPYGLSTTVSAIPGNAVDWIKIELRNSSTPAVITNSYAKFVDVDGQIIEEDGSDMKITGVASGNYYVAVQHRNHFGVMTNTAVTISNSLVINFTGTQASTWQDGTISTNAAMKEVETGFFGLWDGDANNDGYIRYEGSNPDRVSILNGVGVSTATNSLTTTYSTLDVNMDGNVQYEGSEPDRVSILNIIGVSTPTQSFTAHLPL